MLRQEIDDERERIDPFRRHRKLTRAVESAASGDVIHATVYGNQYPSVRTFTIVLGQLLNREITPQLRQFLYFLHRLLSLRAALDDLVDKDGDHAHQGEVYRTPDNLADET